MLKALEIDYENDKVNVDVSKFYPNIDIVEFMSILQLPDKLSCSLDHATATGKSYVMYGIACIMLAEGAVDQVLVLCPSKPYFYTPWQRGSTYRIFYSTKDNMASNYKMGF